VSPEDPRTLVIDQADRELALSILRRYCAALMPYATGGRVFCDAYTPDWHPLIASVSDQPEFVVATGCAGSGYRLGPAMAKAAVSLLAASTEVAHAHANPGSE
jgi:glycine/D-amino acid oxidase-like deaminating enzyme